VRAVQRSPWSPAQAVALGRRLRLGWPGTVPSWRSITIRRLWRRASYREQVDHLVWSVVKEFRCLEFSKGYRRVVCVYARGD
jgi:hypothetical protein